MRRKVQGDAAVGASRLGVNEVIVCGRISGSPEERELPSGGTVAPFRRGGSTTA